MAAVSNDDGFASDAGIELIASLTDELLDIDGVATVTSLVTVPQSLAEARGRLLSDDGRTTALVLQMMTGEEFEIRRHQILLEVEKAIEAYELDARLAGYGVVFDALNEESTIGTTTLLIYAHGLMIILLIIFFMITAQYDVDKTRLTLPDSFVRSEIEKDSAVVVASLSPDVVIKFTAGTKQSQPLMSVDDVLSAASLVVIGNPEKSFVIKADAKVTYGVIDDIIDTLQQAHVRNIYFLTTQETK